MTTFKAALFPVLLSAQALLAQAGLAQTGQAESAAPANTVDQSALGHAGGMVMLDYAPITMTDGRKFDLLGAHYLHQLNDYLYFGAGLSGPMVGGDYGGFFAVDVTLHAQQKVFGNWFVDAGVGIGAGAGGDSVAGIITLSGTGLYLKKYVGFGYEGEHLNFGVNYSDIGIVGSPINDGTINFFIQKPIGYATGAYSDAGKAVSGNGGALRAHDSIVSVEYNHVTQINPKGLYTGAIGLVSPQYSQFIDANNYVFFGLDLGYSGLIWYNQAQGGIGRRFSLSDNLNIYGQLGIGTGGWVTDTFDTGPGMVIYPKVKAEFLWDRIGATVSAGYYFAPFGTSKNWTIGAGLNYHFGGGAEGAKGSELKGVRLNLFDRQAFALYSNGIKQPNLNLAALQVDYAVNDHVYLAAQIAAATNHFKGYAGYVEGLVGAGWQSDLFFDDRLQGFAQVMYGMNDIGIDPQYEIGGLLYPAVGVSYSLGDKYAIYGQVGKTVSLDQYLKPGPQNSFENWSVGLGMTYRFALPD